MKNTNKVYYKCIHCGDVIYYNTHKKLIFCNCNKMGIDGCEYYVRIIGNEVDYRVIRLKNSFIV